MQPKNARRAVRALIAAARVPPKPQVSSEATPAVEGAAADEGAAGAGAAGEGGEAEEEGPLPPSLAAQLRRMALYAGDAHHFRNDVGVPVLPLRVPTLEPWRPLRDLSSIWADRRARGHTGRSTVLVDDTPGKCPLSPGSVLLVASWDGTTEAAAAHASRHTLRRLAEYLTAASRAQAKCGEEADVRVWLEQHPFCDIGTQA